MKKVLVLIIFLFLCFSPVTNLSAQSSYSYYIVDSLEDGDLNSCGDREGTCTLNSAIYLSELVASNAVILVKVPYKITGGFGTEDSAVPFYIVKEITIEGEIWRMFPAPLLGYKDTSNLKEDISDYFLTLNFGKLVDKEKETFYFTFFLGQFRKFYDPGSKTNDYDLKIPLYRIADFSNNAVQFNNSLDLRTYLSEMEDGNVFFEKILLNGFHLRIYEESFSTAMVTIIVVLSLLVVAMNLLVFPNIALYIALLINGIRRTKVIGLIFDEKTGETIRFAVLRIYNITDGGKSFEKQTIGDLDGKYYGFPMNKGKYLLEIKQSNYETKEIIFDVLEDEDLVVADIGLSQLKSGVEKNFVARLKNYLYKNIKDINRALVVFSFFIAIINIALVQDLFNIFVLILALIQLVAYRTTYIKKSWGVVLDSATKRPVKSAFIKVYDPLTMVQVNTLLTDDRGRFGFILRKPEYLISVNAVGYRFPSDKDTNPKDIKQPIQFASNGRNTGSMHSREIFIRFKSPESKKVSLVILLDRIN